MIDHLEQLLKPRPGGALKVCHDRNSRPSRDLRCPQHSSHAEMVYKEHATSTNQFSRRPGRIGSNSIARIRENVASAARLADDDVRMHRPSVRFDQQMIEADP